MRVAGEAHIDWLFRHALPRGSIHKPDGDAQHICRVDQVKRIHQATDEMSWAMF